MTVFVDTSALYATLDADDLNHGRASVQWRHLVEAQTPLVTTNYVMVETTALLQHRIGIDAIRLFQEDVRPVLGIEWVTEAEHMAGMASVLAVGSRRLSLVDCVSFTAMRGRGIRDVFAFDQHFSEQGFTCLPR